MASKWKPYVTDASGQRRSLLALFHAGLAKRIGPRELCQIGAGVFQFSSYDSRQALQLSEALIEYAPDDPTVWYFRSQALRLNRADGEAVQACDRALDLNPDHLESLAMKGKLLLQTGELDEAECQLRHLEAKAPGLAAAALCECFLRQGKLENVRERISRSTSGLVGPTGLLALDCVRAILDNDTDRLASLHDHTLISVSHIAEQDNAGHLRALNRDLGTALTLNPAMVDDPASTTTVHGRQAFLNDLLPEQMLAEVLALIRSRVATYIDEHAEHPYLDNLAPELGLTIWAVSLDGHGYQDPHCHPDGTLSGVYYVDVARDQGAVGTAGNIEFWQPPRELVGEAKADTISVRPQDGTTVVFPSYFYHRTIPHRGRDGRVSIAFDIG